MPVSFTDDATGIEFVVVPAGTFQMGRGSAESGGYANELPVHVVTLSAFHMSVSEVTRAQFGRFQTDQTPSRESQVPVTDVSFMTAVQFCAWMTARGDGRTYTLPTEAQWEYACRAGTRTAYSFGGPEALARHAWTRANSSGRMQPVRQLLPNPWGFYDIHGNAWEWCLDAYDPQFYSKAEAVGLDPVNSSYDLPERVARGGSGLVNEVGCRSAFRYHWSVHGWDDIGFRVVSTIAR